MTDPAVDQPPILPNIADHSPVEIWEGSWEWDGMAIAGLQDLAGETFEAKDFLKAGTAIQQRGSHRNGCVIHDF